MNFTVLGATGFIGRALVSRLRANGHDVWTPSRDDPGIVTKSLGRVIYCIGLTADFRTRPFDTVRAHVGVLADILERSDFESLLYLSSTRVYARTTTTNETAPLMVDACDPSDLYNLSKLTGESLCHSCGRERVSVARISNVIGEDLDSQNFLFDLIRGALAGTIELQSDAASSKDYIWIDDVVKVLIDISIAGTQGVYNVAGGTNLTHAQVLDCLVDSTGAKVVLSPKAPLHRFPLIDIGRIKNEFAFTPQPFLERLPGLISTFRSSRGPH